MGQPTPPGDIPLYEGLGADWNDIVGGFPEDKRAELAPLLKQRIDAYEPLKQWEDLQKSGITPDYAGTALNLFSIIENNPRQVYDTIGKYLNITPAEAKEAVETLEEEGGDDPRIQTMQQQLDTLTQIALAQRQQTTAEKQAADQDAAVEKEIGAVKKKYGDSEVNEEEVLMRMLHKGMTAEQAHLEFSGLVTNIRKTRPSPMVIGGGGAVPRKTIDVKSLSGADTKSLVAQMMEQANTERRA